MDSLVKPGTYLEIGSPEWQAFLIAEIEKYRNTRDDLYKRTQIIGEQIINLENQLKKWFLIEKQK